MHPDAIEDLIRIATEDGLSGERLAVFLLEYLGVEEKVLWLAVPEHDDGNMRIDRISSLVRKGKDIWRVKLMGRCIGIPDKSGKPPRKHVMNHRIVYAHDDGRGMIWILGLFKRDEYNYEPEDPRTQRILQAYDGLGLPTTKYLR